jgi:RNA polymerase sigma-70 factor (ECF subfamily)
MSGIDLGALSSEELAARFAETREDAYFAEIERRHKRKVCAIGYKILGDFGKAEDVAQESFVLLSMAGDRFKDGSVEGWLCLVARRLALNVHKRFQRLGGVEDRFVKETLQDRRATGPPDPRIHSILAQLSPRERVCLNLLYGEGFTYKEIAQKTGFTEKQVKAYVQSGRRNFKERWIKEYPDGK